MIDVFAANGAVRNGNAFFFDDTEALTQTGRILGIAAMDFQEWPSAGPFDRDGSKRNGATRACSWGDSWGPLPTSGAVLVHPRGISFLGVDEQGWYLYAGLYADFSTEASSAEDSESNWEGTTIVDVLGGSADLESLSSWAFSCTPFEGGVAIAGGPRLIIVDWACDALWWFDYLGGFYGAPLTEGFTESPPYTNSDLFDSLDDNDPFYVICGFKGPVESDPRTPPVLSTDRENLSPSGFLLRSFGNGVAAMHRSVSDCIVEPTLSLVNLSPGNFNQYGAHRFSTGRILLLGLSFPNVATLALSDTSDVLTTSWKTMTLPEIWNAGDTWVEWVSRVGGATCAQHGERLWIPTGAGIADVAISDLLHAEDGDVLPARAVIRWDSADSDPSRWSWQGQLLEKQGAAATDESWDAFDSNIVPGPLFPTSSGAMWLCLQGSGAAVYWIPRTMRFRVKVFSTSNIAPILSVPVPGWTGDDAPTLLGLTYFDPDSDRELP